MARVVCVWLPTWPTDRLRRRPGAPPPAEPLVTAAREGSRRVIAGACAAARAAGLAPGMTVGQAQAIRPGLKVAAADPAADAAGLERLAVWCLRYAPVAAADPPDGVVVDVAGAAHLMGGETALLDDLGRRLAAAGIAAGTAVADTWAASWGLARFGGSEGTLADLPVAALRLDGGTVASLQRLGFDTVGELLAAHRPSLALRFGPGLGRRLDQVLGKAGEPIDPVRPPGIPQARLAFAEPLLHGEALHLALRRLALALCTHLEAEVLSARRLDLLFRRTDGTTAALRAGSAQGARAPAHIVRLFEEKLGTVDPGFGVEVASLAATRTEPFTPHQLAAQGAEAREAELGPLIDRIASRIGARRLYRVVPVESDLPERAQRKVAALSPPSGLSWHDGPRPALVLDPPEPVKVTALLPDHPPRLFVWRGRPTPIKRVDGPERVHGEWWRDDAETWLVRDYFRVEAEDGARYWLFRVGKANGAARWFLHGAFG